jgi:glycine/D-amino acid oxidase-like deaminating enzyme
MRNPLCYIAIPRPSPCTPLPPRRVYAIKANGHSIACDYLVIATHVPLMGKAGLVSAILFQSKLALYSSYAIGAKASKGTFPEALFWDTSDPYHYIRVDRQTRHDYAVVGGEDHKTGQDEDAEHCFRELEKVLAAYAPKAQVNARWSGQVIETNDGLPLMGETAKRQFVATGYAGNGMTFGTLGAMMGSDAALGRRNPWAALFDVHRKKLVGGTWDYVKENLDYPYYMIKDRLFAAEAKTSPRSMPTISRTIARSGGSPAKGWSYRARPSATGWPAPPGPSSRCTP